MIRPRRQAIVTAVIRFLDTWLWFHVLARRTTSAVASERPAGDQARFLKRQLSLLSQ